MNSRVVMAAHTESMLCKHLAVFDICLCAFLVEDVKEQRIFCFTGHNDHIFEVLCTGTDERDAADVDLLDDVLLGSSAGDSLLKG